MRHMQVVASAQQQPETGPTGAEKTSPDAAALAAKALEDAAAHYEEAVNPEQENRDMLPPYDATQEPDPPFIDPVDQGAHEPDLEEEADDPEADSDALPTPPPTQEPTGPGPLRKALQDIVSEAKAASANTLEKDHFLRFGVILFLAGAAETLARRFKVAAKEVRNILCEQIEAMGAPKAMAKGFAANIDEYLLDKRFFEMYSLGRGSALNQGRDPNASSGFADPKGRAGSRYRAGG